jgi:hypothetical protein
MPLKVTSSLVCAALLASEPHNYGGMLTGADFRPRNQPTNLIGLVQPSLVVPVLMISCQVSE